MDGHESAAASMRTIRFHDYGEPDDVLRMDQIAVPSPGRDRIRVAVHACGLNPADWALCRGLFPGELPRGIGLELSGTVEAVGQGVADVAVGDVVLGTADYAGGSSAGAADRAIMNHWAAVPAGLDLVQAAALPMAVETAYRSIESLGVTAGHTLLVSGAGTTIGFAAVQIARMRGARVFATAGETYAGRLRALGATVTRYGDGLAGRVIEAAGQPVDLVLDTAPPSGVLPDLVKTAGGDPRRVLTISDLTAAGELGVRNSLGEGGTLRYDVLGEFAQHAADGHFTIPVARTFALADWRTALDISQSGHARGKLVLLPDSPAASS
jgi:NADPH:quinone reductase-like Zn-dependent oxidoreductase